MGNNDRVVLFWCSVISCLTSLEIGLVLLGIDWVGKLPNLKTWGLAGIRVGSIGLGAALIIFLLADIGWRWKQKKGKSETTGSLVHIAGVNCKRCHHLGIRMTSPLQDIPIYLPGVPDPIFREILHIAVHHTDGCEGALITGYVSLGNEKQMVEMTHQRWNLVKMG